MTLFANTKDQILQKAWAKRGRDSVWMDCGFLCTVVCGPFVWRCMLAGFQEDFSFYMIFLSGGGFGIAAQNSLGDVFF